MNDFTFDRGATDLGRDSLQVADAAGMVWGHSNPAELYRWISRRNDLLRTIAAAFPDPVRTRGASPGGSRSGRGRRGSGGRAFP